MKSALRRFSIGAGRGIGLGLALLLSLVVLVPSICLVWFMNQAVRNERLAVRQKLVDAYRANLALAQEHLESHWKQMAGDLEADSRSHSAQSLFARAVRAGRVDALVFLDTNGTPVYPSSGTAPKRNETRNAGWQEAQALESKDALAAAMSYAKLGTAETNSDLVAQALQAQARCLLQVGQKQAAISILTNLVEQEGLQRAVDTQGRLLVPSARLMLLELSGDVTNGSPGSVFTQLEKSLGDYEDVEMPSSQRRFLMRELTRLKPGQAQFATLAAEDLAAFYVENQPAQPVTPGLRATSLPGVWQFASADGRLIQLHRTDPLISRMRLGADSQILSPDVRLNFFSPGQETEGALFSQAAGADFPGWRLGLSLVDQGIFQTASRQRVSSYLWIGVLVIATVLVLGSLALGLVRRQMTLTQLRNDLVANVTHELKTPLSSMRLLVETLLDAKTLNEKTTREYLELIARENFRLSRLIDNFLTFSRMERHKYAFGFTEVRPGEIVDAASAALRDRLNCPGCRFQVDVGRNLPLILADADAMVTVLVNLLDNAMKYSGEEKQITLTAGSENGHVIFAVKDNGIGLVPGETRRIFKRFYRVDQPLSRSGGGCGLGLSIVQFVVTAHHGTVRVQSQPGKGSEFIIQIPGIETAVPKDPDMTRVQ